MNTEGDSENRVENLVLYFSEQHSVRPEIVIFCTESRIQ